MARLINVDEILGSDIEVELKGEVYVLPSDLPIELYLALTDPANADLDPRDLAGHLYDKILDLFRYRRPDLRTLPIGLNDLVKLVPAIYNQASDDDAGDDGERPTTRRTRGGTSKPQKASNGRPRNRSTQ
jgi:hypothetical protein